MIVQYAVVLSTNLIDTFNFFVFHESPEENVVALSYFLLTILLFCVLIFFLGFLVRRPFQFLITSESDNFLVPPWVVELRLRTLFLLLQDPDINTAFECGDCWWTILSLFNANR